MNTGDGEKLQDCPIVANSLIRSKIMFLSSYTLGHTYTYMQMVDSLCGSSSNDNIFKICSDSLFQTLNPFVDFFSRLMDSRFQFKDLHSYFPLSLNLNLVFLKSSSATIENIFNFILLELRIFPQED